MLDRQWLKNGFILQYKKDFYIAKDLIRTHHRVGHLTHFVYAPDFFLQDRGIFSFSDYQIVSREQLLSFLEQEQEKMEVPPFFNPQFSSFESMYWNFQKSQTLNKIVAMAFSMSVVQISIRQKAFLLRNSILKNEGFVYGMWKGGEGILGCTPEYLFDADSNRTTTMALAGTAKTHSNTHLLEDEKERLEHQIVIDGIKNQWKGFLIKTSPTYEWNFRSLKHLRTDITITHSRMPLFLSLVNRMHPTAALGGEPKTEAFCYLKKSTIGRKRFGAPFGIYLKNGKSFCVVAIRNIQWNCQGSMIGAGCGLTKKSKLQNEWKEWKIKKESVIQTLWK